MGFKVKINERQLPIKFHYFFFMAAMGPILPFLSVYGKQMGASTTAIGAITAVLPMLYLISKPIFGFVVDYFRAYRKIIFLGILVSGSSAFFLLYFLPMSPKNPKIDLNTTLFSHPSIFCSHFKYCDVQNGSKNCDEPNYHGEINCQQMCNDSTENNFSIFVLFKHASQIKDDIIIPTCLVPNSRLQKERIAKKNYSTCDISEAHECTNMSCKIESLSAVKDDYCLYRSYEFWIFVLLFSIGSVSFNVTNSISDAICFDILGESGSMGYGRQRLWGSIGFGIAAFIAGYAIDFISRGDIIKSYTPAFILVMVFTLIDVICCQKLQLPQIPISKTIVKDVKDLLKTQSITIFLTFATIAGIIDSFIIYFLFWYLEDLALETNCMDQIKIIEGLIVAAETLGGEVIIFLLSGKILKKFGYGYTLSFCFICYALRLVLISMAPNPWWVIPIEFFMQGPSYALCYTTIVSMASAIAPPGSSATMQGIAAGMDDGFGFAIGSLLSGVLYKYIGGLNTFHVFAVLSLIAGIGYLLLYIRILKNEIPSTKSNGLSIDEEIVWASPEDALRECETADRNYELSHVL